MMLSDLMLRLEYRSDEVVLADDLYEKCLPQCSHFDRAVGFFSASVFAACPEGFRAFFTSGGRMRVVCCPILSQSDIEAIHNGYFDRPTLIRSACPEVLTNGRAKALLEIHRLTSWLIATGRLDVRIALRDSRGGNHIYHEKLGLFGDRTGNWIAFSGSANETLSGIEGNFEAIDVFRSWSPEERRRVDQKLRAFKQLWRNETAGVEVITFAQAATRGELKVRTTSAQANNKIPHGTEVITSIEDMEPLPGIEELLLIPSDTKLRDHQKVAVRKWFESNGRGLFVMATGAGKTIAALAAATKLYEWLNAPLFIVIVCPYLHLCAQWIEEAKQFGLDPLLCAVDRRTWYEPLSTRLFNLAFGTRKLASVVVSNTTFASQAFQTLLNRAPRASLLIADEVHHLGAPGLRTALPEGFAFRIGLSATPSRYQDATGSAKILEYFGDPVCSYTLKDALQSGVLCPYRYIPVLVDLEDDELESYVELTRKIGQHIRVTDPREGNTYLDSLLLKRARITGTARGKIPALAEHLAPLRKSTHNLIYCGDGTVEGEIEQTVIRHVDAVVRVLGRDLGMAVAKYVADTPLTKRHQLRRRFTDGDLQGLVAIRCLDEGVDVPETRRAFILASSTNPRQFIQRRGRILRQAAGKEMAEIYDFITVPAPEEIEPTNPIYGTARRLFRRELSRIVEFAGLAVNGPEALNVLLPLRQSLNLLDFGEDDE